MYIYMNIYIYIILTYMNIYIYIYMLRAVFGLCSHKSSFTDYSLIYLLYIHIYA